MGSTPISAVVATRDRPELLDRCLGALRETLGPDDELIVADSASTSPRVREVAGRHGAGYVRLDVPGTSIARNAGWRAARHDVVAFVDDDILVEKTWAGAVRAAFERTPDLGFVTGRVTTPPGQETVDHPTSIEHHSEPEQHTPGEPRPRGISGNLAVRRGVLERVGGFDELLGPGRRFRAGEDKDLFDRMLQAGAAGRYEPDMAVAHEQWRSRRERLRLDWSYGIGGGARLAKLARMDRRHARALAIEILWRWGLRDFAACVRNRYKLGAAAALLRVAGMIVGFAEGMTVPVRAGHFVATRGRGR